jgi:hypothetical protein
VTFNTKNPFTSHYILVGGRWYNVPCSISNQNIIFSRHGLTPFRISKCFSHRGWFEVIELCELSIKIQCLDGLMYLVLWSCGHRVSGNWDRFKGYRLLCVCVGDRWGMSWCRGQAEGVYWSVWHDKWCCSCTWEVLTDDTFRWWCEWRVGIRGHNLKRWRYLGIDGAGWRRWERTRHEGIWKLRLYKFNMLRDIDFGV